MVATATETATRTAEFVPSPSVGVSIAPRPVEGTVTITVRVMVPWNSPPNSTIVLNVTTGEPLLPDSGIYISSPLNYPSVVRIGPNISDVVSVRRIPLSSILPWATIVDSQGNKEITFTIEAVMPPWGSAVTTRALDTVLAVSVDTGRPTVDEDSKVTCIVPHTLAPVVSRAFANVSDFQLLMRPLITHIADTISRLGDPNPVHVPVAGTFLDFLPTHFLIGPLVVRVVQNTPTSATLLFPPTNVTVMDLDLTAPATSLVALSESDRIVGVYLARLQDYNYTHELRRFAHRLLNASKPTAGRRQSSVCSPTDAYGHCAIRLHFGSVRQHFPQSYLESLMANGNASLTNISRITINGASLPTTGAINQSVPAAGGLPSFHVNSTGNVPEVRGIPSISIVVESLNQTEPLVVRITAESGNPILSLGDHRPQCDILVSGRNQFVVYIAPSHMAEVIAVSAGTKMEKIAISPQLHHFSVYPLNTVVPLIHIEENNRTMLTAICANSSDCNNLPPKVMLGPFVSSLVNRQSSIAQYSISTSMSEAQLRVLAQRFSSMRSPQHFDTVEDYVFATSLLQWDVRKEAIQQRQLQRISSATGYGAPLSRGNGLLHPLQFLCTFSSDDFVLAPNILLNVSGVLTSPPQPTVRRQVNNSVTQPPVVISIATSSVTNVILSLNFVDPLERSVTDAFQLEGRDQNITARLQHWDGRTTSLSQQPSSRQDVAFTAALDPGRCFTLGRDSSLFYSLHVEVGIRRYQLPFTAQLREPALSMELLESVAYPPVSRSAVQRVSLRWTSTNAQCTIDQPLLVALNAEVHGAVSVAVSQDSTSVNASANNPVLCTTAPAPLIGQLSCRVTSCASTNVTEVRVVLLITYPDFYNGPIALRYAAALGEECGPFTTGRISVSDPTAGSQAGNASAPLSTSAPIGNAQLRSVFGMGNSIFTTCTDPITISLIVYLILLIIALIAFAVALRSKSQQEYSSWQNIPQWRSLLLYHSWLQLVVPCHALCFVTHLLTFANHVLSLLVVVAGATLLFGEDETASYAIFAIVVFSVIICQPSRFPIRYWFWQWTFSPHAVAKLQEAKIAGQKLHEKQKVEQIALLRQNTMPLRPVPTESLLALESIILEESGTSVHSAQGAAPPDVHDLDVELDWNPDGNDIDSGWEREERKSRQEATHRDEVLPPPEKPIAAVSGTLTNGATISKLSAEYIHGMPDENIEVMCFTSSDEEDSASSTSSKKAKSQHSGSRFSENEDEEYASHGDMLPIEAKKHPYSGIVANAVLTIMLVLCAYALGSTMVNAFLCSVYKKALLYAIIVDILVMQPVIVLLTLGYRWLATSDVDDALFSELHPHHGELREYSLN